MDDTAANGTIELSGRKVDLSKAFPLLARDWRALKKQGVTADLIVARDVDALCGYAAYILRKADPEFPVADLDGLPWTAIVRLLRRMGEYERTVDALDIPFSIASSSSPASSGGISPTSSS